MKSTGSTLLGLDIGTTHCKAALFSERGDLLKLAKTKTEAYTDKGWAYFDPERLWFSVVRLIREITEPGGDRTDTTGHPADMRAIAAIGIASMAETGLLVDPVSGRARSPFLPWYSRCAVTQAERIAAESDLAERFAAHGLHPSFKHGLAKLLWLQENDPGALSGSMWLSASDYVAYRLTGRMATDYTLAARTYAFRLDRRDWDRDWVRHFGLEPSLFPEAVPSGAAVGSIHRDAATALGLPAGLPVTIAGHDHVAATLAVGVVNPGQVMDSMGTAETLVGVLPERALTAQDRMSGLAFGIHPAKGRYFWMGGLSASGGAVEWFRSVLSEPALDYERILERLAGFDPAAGPTGILFFPYLTGSGAPRPDGRARAAFVGLTADHGQGDLLRAVLEGTAYELEWIRRTGEQATGAAIRDLIVTGGGTHNPAWLQIKASVSGCPLRQPERPEAALLGAVLLAGVACGLYADVDQAAAAAASAGEVRSVQPQPQAHSRYRQLFEEGYVPLQEPLRALYRVLSDE